MITTIRGPLGVGKATIAKLLTKIKEGHKINNTNLSINETVNKIIKILLQR